eukprot:SAG31_NODE_41582_length_275_cov_0.880682_1_plen_70_part_10
MPGHAAAAAALDAQGSFLLFIIYNFIIFCPLLLLLLFDAQGRHDSELRHLRQTIAKLKTGLQTTLLNFDV